MNQVKTDILEHIATLSEKDGYSREVNIVSFNNRVPLLDIRAWRQDGNGSKTPLKGVRLTDDEARALLDALTAYLKGGGHE